ncbi:hypothetical protein Trydic_g11158 [Trypoxylus dichotomus]
MARKRVVCFDNGADVSQLQRVHLQDDENAVTEEATQKDNATDYSEFSKEQVENSDSEQLLRTMKMKTIMLLLQKNFCVVTLDLMEEKPEKTEKMDRLAIVREISRSSLTITKRVTHLKSMFQ